MTRTSRQHLLDTNSLPRIATRDVSVCSSCYFESSAGESPSPRFSSVFSVTVPNDSNMVSSAQLVTRGFERRSSTLERCDDCHLNIRHNHVRRLTDVLSAVFIMHLDKANSHANVRIDRRLDLSSFMGHETGQDIFIIVGIIHRNVDETYSAEMLHEGAWNTIANGQMHVSNTLPETISSTAVALIYQRSRRMRLIPSGFSEV